MANIAERIKEERQRLGLSQEKFGGIAGVSKQTVIAWEKGSTSPTALQMAELSAQGFDALYVLAGERVRRSDYQETQENPSAYAKAKTDGSSAALNYIEKAVLDRVRQLNLDNQQMLYGIVESMLKTQNLRDAMEDFTSGKGADSGGWFD